MVKGLIYFITVIDIADTFIKGKCKVMANIAGLMVIFVKKIGN